MGYVPLYEKGSKTYLKLAVASSMEVFGLRAYDGAVDVEGFISAEDLEV